MNSEAPSAHGVAAPFSGNTEIMGGSDKPGHDDQRGKEVKSRIHLDAG